MKSRAILQPKGLSHGGLLVWICMAAAQLGATRVPQLPVKDLFQQTAVVFIGTASETTAPCKGLEGPCSGVTFTDLDIVAGKVEPELSREISFALPEGQLPDGTSLKIPGAPEFVSGTRYLVFVRAGAWHITPVTNWFHSVFREVRAAQGKVTLFANDQGLAVTGLDERGFQFGVRIALPAALLRPTPATRGEGKSGASYSKPPQVDEKVQPMLTSDAAAVEKLGLPKEKLVELVAALARKYGMNRAGEIRTRPQKSGLYDTQLSPASQTRVGLEKAAPEPATRRKAVFPEVRAKDAEPRTTPEKSSSKGSSPGRETAAPPAKEPKTK